MVDNIGGDPGNFLHRSFGFFLGIDQVANSGADEEATDDDAGGAKRKVMPPLVKNTPKVVARRPF